MHHFLKSILLSIGTILIVNISQAQWRNIGSHPQDQFVHLSFGDENRGFAILRETGTSAKSFQVSQDAGLSWDIIELDSAMFFGSDYMSLFFVDTLTGYMALRRQAPGSSLSAFIYKTIDGGKNWTDVSPPNLNVGFGYMDISFVDKNYGFVSSGNKIHKTTDGGNSWSDFVCGGWGGPVEIDFFDKDHGIMGLWDGSFAYKGSIFTTTDGGTTWDSLIFENWQSSIGDVDYASNTTAYALSDYGFNVPFKIYRTTDNGTSWDTIPLQFLLDSLDQASDIYFENDSVGYMCSLKGDIFKTEDGADNWTMVYDGDETKALIDLAGNGENVYSTGPFNTLLINDQFVGINPPLTEETFTVFPNPIAQGQDLYFSKKLTGQIQLFNVRGNLVASEQLNESDHMHLGHLQLNDGMYLYVIQGDHTVKGKVLVRVR